jgi:hypothetical protein
MQYDNYNIDIAGARDQVWTAKCDLSAWPGALLTFDVAYADYNATYSDSLEVLISDDCGLTFTSVYRKGGQVLATAPTLTAQMFIPSATDWRKDSVDISAFTGQSEVILAFVNIGRFGQALYIDNIAIDTLLGTSIVRPAAEYSRIYPNPFGDLLRIEVPAGEQYRLQLTDALGQDVLDERLTSTVSLETSAFPSGAYFYRLTDAEGRMTSGKLVKNR